MKTNFKDKKGTEIEVGDTLFNNFTFIGEIVFLKDTNKLMLATRNNIIDLKNIETKKYCLSREFSLINITTFVNKISWSKNELFSRKSLKEFLKSFRYLGISEENEKLFIRKEKNIVIEVRLNEYLKF